MGSESLYRNHFQTVVRARRDLEFMKVSRNFNYTDLGYRASNMITIPHIMLLGAHFKSAGGGVRESSP